MYVYLNGPGTKVAMNDAMHFVMIAGMHIAMNKAGVNVVINVAIYFAMKVGIYVASMLVCMLFWIRLE